MITKPFATTHSSDVPIATSSHLRKGSPSFIYLRLREANQAVLRLNEHESGCGVRLSLGGVLSWGHLLLSGSREQTDLRQCPPSLSEYFLGIWRNGQRYRLITGWFGVQVPVCPPNLQVLTREWQWLQCLCLGDRGVAQTENALSSGKLQHIEDDYMIRGFVTGRMAAKAKSRFHGCSLFPTLVIAPEKCVK